MDRELIAYLDRRFDELREGLLDAVDERFDAVGERFDAVDERFDKIDGHLGTVDARLDAADERFDKIDGRLDRLEEETHGTRILVEDLRRTTELLAEGIANVDQKADRLHEEAMREIRGVRSLVEVALPSIVRRVDAVEKRVDVLEEGA